MTRVPYCCGLDLLQMHHMDFGMKLFVRKHDGMGSCTFQYHMDTKSQCGVRHQNGGFSVSLVFDDVKSPQPN
ncbi:hypothetical protein FGO68_gene545 [Halteria grandinella]|uniref:Uncharacterized protein n=1 Tax=Halteria grandinella TaxID=5974 RepID=A0A8J8SU36_HALGN|nr:hypothetical protein FGO68_gene545 [Halteria grandinella]